MAAMQQLPQEVAIQKQEFLRPAAGDVEAAKFELSVFDGVMRAALYQKRILFFPAAAVSRASGLSTATELLKRSLQEALVYFPFAGRMLVNSDVPSGLQLDCSGELSVQFTEATTAATLRDLGDFVPSQFCDKLCEIGDPKFPWDAQTLLLFVQVTGFACGGMSLGIGFSHQLCDGVSFWHFVNSWAQIARGEELSLRPLVSYGYRTPLFDDDDEERVEKYASKMGMALVKEGKEGAARTQTIEWKKKEKNLAVKLYKLDKAIVQQLRANAATESPSNRFTTFELVAAYFWKMMASVRQEEDSAVYSFAVLINCREKVASLPKGYFGNAISLVVAKSTFGELRNSNGVCYAAGAIHEAIVKPETKELEEFVAFFNIVLNNQSRFSMGGMMSAFSMVVSSPRHPVYESDFGFGKPAGVTFGTNDLNEGKLYLFPSAHGDGGINAYVVLQPEDAEKLPEELLL